jgi:ribonuclease R
LAKASTQVGERRAKGVFQQNPGGYGFVQRFDGEDSVFIPPPRISNAIDGDHVEVEVWPSEKGFEGKVVTVLERQRTRVVGILEKSGRKAWALRAEDPRVLRPVEVTGGPGQAIVGELVVGQIVSYPEKRRDAIWVTVEKSLGEPGRLQTQVAKILAESGIDEEFPEDVTVEAAGVPTEVRESDLEGREDLRQLPFMTIDPEDARDFDDAVCVELLGEDPEGSDYRVHVAVADVSHYVREGTAIQIEAEHRCFSAYLPERAIPMLPEQLSANICSLVPKQDRLAMVVEMRVGPAGEVKKPKVMASVIHSRRRLSYEDVAAVFDDKGKVAAKVQDRIKELRRVADRLRAARMRRGSIELDLPEARIVLDQDDPERVRDVRRSRSSKSVARAYNLIEELMIAANEAVGSLAVQRKLPALFRVHEKPPDDKLERLVMAAESLGVKADPTKLSRPRGVQKFLSRAEGSPRKGAFNMLMLRAMAQADYRTENVGHFALASEAYVHFTSPIRRYPDLVAHRVLKAHLSKTGGKAGPKPIPHMPKKEAAETAAVRSSTRERTVLQAERDSKSLYAAAHVRDRIGDRFEGTVTGISSTGIFVSLDDPFVDGMARIAKIEKDWRDRLSPDDAGVRLIGENTGKSITLGDRVIVEVENASLARGQIDFVLMEVLQ